MTYIFKVHVDQPHFLKVLYVFWWVELLNVMFQCRDYNNINTRLESPSHTAQGAGFSRGKKNLLYALQALNMDILFRAFIMVSCEFRLSTVLNVWSLLYEGFRSVMKFGSECMK
jgi:hypothetical protein